MRIVDLSATIAPSPADASPLQRVDIHYTSHAQGAAQIQAMLHVPGHLLRNGEGWAIEELARLGTHNVTHVDAPWHYNSQIQGQKAATIDELPLEWFFGDGVVLDMTSKADGEKVDVARRRNLLWRKSAMPSSRTTSCSCEPAATRSTVSLTTCSGAVR